MTSTGHPTGFNGISIVVVMVVLLIATMVGSVPTLAGPGDGPVPTLSMGLEPTQLEAEVTQSQLGEVEFQGTAEVDQNALMKSVLTLSATVNTGWPLELSPQSFDVTGPSTLEFAVTVIVPPATSSLLTGNVIVTGQLKAPGLAPVTAKTSTVVTVGQYFKLRLEAEEPQIRFDRGESGEFELNVYNDGNGQDTFDLSFESVPEGIRTSLSTSQVTVQQDESVTIEVDVEITSDARRGSNPVIVKVVSLESGSNYWKTFPLYPTVTTAADAIPIPALPVPAVVLVVVLVAITFRSRRC